MFSELAARAMAGYEWVSEFLHSDTRLSLKDTFLIKDYIHQGLHSVQQML